MKETPDVPIDNQQEVVVQPAMLHQLMVDLLVEKGMYEAEARIGADRLLEADLRGIHSHGSRALPRYLDAMERGDIDPRAKVLCENETSAIAVLDGGRALGHVAATHAMQLAIKKAKDVGTGTVAIHNGQHYGAASVYTLMAAREGMIGFSTTSTGPATVTAYGSRQPAVANNAQSWSVPTRAGTPFVLDFACAVSSWGKVESMGMYGLPLPAGWAVDVDGNETAIPSEAKWLLPMSGARGFGLAFMSAVLAGALVGRHMPIHKTWSVESDGSEHFFYAIDVQQFGDMEKFYKEIDSTIADIQKLPPAEGFDSVRVPGQLEHERAEGWQRDGIPLHRDHLKRLAAAAEKADVEFPWQLP